MASGLERYNITYKVRPLSLHTTRTVIIQAKHFSNLSYCALEWRNKGKNVHNSQSPRPYIMQQLYHKNHIIPQTYIIIVCYQLVTLIHICRPFYKIMDSSNYIMHANDLRASWQYSANIRIVKTKNDHGHSTSNLAIPFGELKQLRTGCLSILMFLTPLAEVTP